jgi:hypothetical protein
MLIKETVIYSKEESKPDKSNYPLTLRLFNPSLADRENPRYRSPLIQKFKIFRTVKN